MNTELLKLRIKELCKKKGVSQTTAFIESGAGKNFLSNLPSISQKNLVLLAKYFGVSVDYLTGEEDEEAFARKIMGLVAEWLIDNEYSYNEGETAITISKNGKTISFAYGDFMRESLRINEISKDGFELAMLNWERVNFTNDSSVRSNHHLFNAINESPNATLTISENNGFSKQELEVISVFRSLGIKEQAEFITYLLRLKSDKSE